MQGASRAHPFLPPDCLLDAGLPLTGFAPVGFTVRPPPDLPGRLGVEGREGPSGLDMMGSDVVVAATLHASRQLCQPRRCQSVVLAVG